MARGMNHCIGWVWWRMATQLKLTTQITGADQPLRLWRLRSAGPVVRSWALLRLPVYRFRPAHADPLHFDLWHKGMNLLRDGGTYAYNASSSDLATFPGIACHNSLQFDALEPMPRLGRFLWGDWLQMDAPPKQELNPSPLPPAPRVAINAK